MASISQNRLSMVSWCSTT